VFSSACQLDFFVVSYVDYLLIEGGPINHMSFENCTVKNYATDDMMKWIGADINAKSIVPNDVRDDWKSWMIYDEEHPFTTTINAMNTTSSSVPPSTTMRSSSSSVALSTTSHTSSRTTTSTKRQ
jgi:hypothetical protein